MRIEICRYDLSYLEGITIHITREEVFNRNSINFEFGEKRI